MRYGAAAVTLLLIVFAADGYVYGYSLHPSLRARVCHAVLNSAVTAWISGADMVEWLQGELLPLPFLSHRGYFSQLRCVQGQTNYLGKQT